MNETATIGHQAYIQHQFMLHPESLRDYFAGIALAKEFGLHHGENNENRSITARNCYLMADAMLAERKSVNQ